MRIGKAPGKALGLLALMAALASAACVSAPKKEAARAAQGKGDAAAQPAARQAKGDSQGAKLEAYIALRSKAMAARDQNRPGEALDLANEGLKDFPDSPDLTWVKISAYRQLGRPEKARPIVEKLIADGDPSVRDHWHDIGDMYGFDLGDARTAVEWYGKQIQRDPVASGWTYNQRGFSYSNLGEEDKARDDFLRAQEIGKAQGDVGLVNAAKENLARLDAKEAVK